MSWSLSLIHDLVRQFAQQHNVFVSGLRQRYEVALSQPASITDANSDTMERDSENIQHLSALQVKIRSEVEVHLESQHRILESYTYLVWIEEGRKDQDEQRFWQLVQANRGKTKSFSEIAKFKVLNGIAFLKALIQLNILDQFICIQTTIPAHLIEDHIPQMLSKDVKFINSLMNEAQRIYDDGRKMMNKHDIQRIRNQLYQATRPSMDDELTIATGLIDLSTEQTAPFPEVVRDKWQPNASTNFVIQDIYKLIKHHCGLYHNGLDKDTQLDRSRLRSQALPSPDVNATVNSAFSESAHSTFESLITFLTDSHSQCPEQLKLTSNSCFLDIGSGYGQCVIHTALASSSVAHCRGIEAMPLRHQKANDMLNLVKEKATLSSKITSALNRIEYCHADASTSMCDEWIIDASHIYMYIRDPSSVLLQSVLSHISKSVSFKLLICFTTESQLHHLNTCKWLKRFHQIGMRNSAQQEHQCYLYQRDHIPVIPVVMFEEETESSSSSSDDDENERKSDSDMDIENDETTDNEASDVAKSKPKKVVRQSITNSCRGRSRERITQKRQQSPASVSAKRQRCTRSVSKDCHELPPLNNPFSVDRLHTALLKMDTTAPLEYYFDLLQRFPDLVEVAAPYSYADDCVRKSAISHRIEDLCRCTHILVYDHDYLIHHSNCFRNLPALKVTGDDSRWELHCDERHSKDSPPTKIWQFFPDTSSTTKENSNSSLAETIYQKFYSHLETSKTLSHFDMHSDRSISIPAEILLEEGVKLLLVFQRENETVSMPGSCFEQYHSPCAHFVQTLPADKTLSVTCNYCSDQHLVEMLSFQLTNPNNWIRATYPSEKYDKLLTQKVDVRFDGLLPSDITAGTFWKMSKEELSTMEKQMVKDLIRYRQSWIFDFESVEQIVFMIDQCLNEHLRQKRSPSHQFITALRSIQRKLDLFENVSRMRSTLADLYAKAIALLVAFPTPTLSSLCARRYGCGNSDVEFGHLLIKDNRVFQYSKSPHVRPLLFIRSLVGFDTSELESSIYENHGKYNMRLTSDAPSTTPTTIKELIDHWNQRFKIHPNANARSLSKLTLPVDSTIYYQDISVQDVMQLKDRLKQQLFPSELVDGVNMKWCQVPNDGADTPLLLLCKTSERAFDKEKARVVTTECHNEPQRVGFYHHMFPNI